MTCGVDLFGNQIIEKNKLGDIFGVSPFSTLRANDGKWRAKKQQWLNIGIKSEVGRGATTYSFEGWINDKKAGGVKGMDTLKDTSIFDPVLCELMYRWFVPEHGKILDPFAGGSVRGIVANKLGYEYQGIDIRQEQIESNEEQAERICTDGTKPTWLVGDSDKVLDTLKGNEYDAIFTCPPYVGLEKYSNLEGDISNMEYNDFMFSLESILRKCSKLLKYGGFMIVVVGEVRDKKGHYYGFVADTIKVMQRCKDLYYYNDAVLEQQLGSAAIRAIGNMKTKKLVKVHQNILIFKKRKIIMAKQSGGNRNVGGGGLPQGSHFHKMNIDGIYHGMIDFAGRKIVVVNIDGVDVPFYCSSGKNPKMGVEPGKWYPFFGLDKNGWLNKGNDFLISDYYASPKLRKIANVLDKKFGDVRDQERKKVGLPGSDDFEQLRKAVNRDVKGGKDNINYDHGRVDLKKRIPNVVKRFDKNFSQEDYDFWVK